MSCVSCHSIHESDPNDQLAKGMRGNKACLQCHGDMATELTAHTRHAADSPGSNCYNCHMPHTSYGLLSAIRGHTIESPNVATTLETGRPNACNLCHLDKTLDWTAEQLAKRTDQAKPDLPAQHRTTAASVLWLLKGDAGQRALAAWHMGWEPALQASGSAWQPPLLAELLNDPYSAVRYVAHKALVRQPGYRGFEYDFVADEPSRLAKREVALAKWKPPTADTPANPAAVLLGANGQRLTNRVQRLIEARDNRPMRLRE
jgi:predicted CXXCH cytochrome family protein